MISWNSSPLLALAGCAAVLTSIVLGLSAPREEALTWYDQGRRELAEGDYATARRNFAKAVDAEPGQPMFLAAHGLANTSESSQSAMPLTPWSDLPLISPSDLVALNRAAEDFSEARRLSPDDATFCSNLAWVESFRGHDSAASAEFRRAVSLDPSDAATRISLGFFLERHGQVDEAMEAYAQSLVTSARIVDSQFFEDLRLRHPSEARAVVLRATTIAERIPASPMKIATLGKLHAAQGDIALAERYYKDALEQLSNLSYTWTNLGLLAVARRDHRSAELDFERALFLDGQNTIAANELAAFALSVGQSDRALSLYERTLFTPTLSNHAERTWRIYHVPSAKDDDVVPEGLLSYIAPRVHHLPLCGDWLATTSVEQTSKEVKRRLAAQERFCDTAQAEDK